MLDRKKTGISYRLRILPVGKLSQGQVDRARNAVLRLKDLQLLKISQIDVICVDQAMPHMYLVEQRHGSSYKTAEELIKDHTPINLKEVCREVLKRLKEMHEKQITHNCISPKTVFIKEGKRVKLGMPLLSAIIKCKALRQNQHDHPKYSPPDVREF